VVLELAAAVVVLGCELAAEVMVETSPVLVVVVAVGHGHTAPVAVVVCVIRLSVLEGTAVAEVVTESSCLPTNVDSSPLATDVGKLLERRVDVAMGQLHVAVVVGTTVQASTKLLVVPDTGTVTKVLDASST